jgi:hypothetical protein
MTMQFVSQKERERVVVQYLTSICNDGRCKSGKSQVHLSCEKNREKFLIVINIIMNNNNNNRETKKPTFSHLSRNGKQYYY